MSEVRARIKVRPDRYQVKNALGLTILWIPLSNTKDKKDHQRALIESIHKWVDHKYDLTRWVELLTGITRGHLVIVFQLFSDDKRKPVEVIVSNDDGIEEIEKNSLTVTKVKGLSYAYILTNLTPKTSHTLEISLIDTQ